MLLVGHCGIICGEVEFFLGFFLFSPTIPFLFSFFFFLYYFLIFFFLNFYIYLLIHIGYEKSHVRASKCCYFC